MPRSSSGCKHYRSWCVSNIRITPHDRQSFYRNSNRLVSRFREREPEHKKHKRHKKEHLSLSLLSLLHNRKEVKILAESSHLIDRTISCLARNIQNTFNLNGGFSR